MTIARSVILKGPCKFSYDSVEFHSRGNVEVTFVRGQFEKSSSAFGTHAHGIADKMIRLSFQPIMYNAARIAILNPRLAVKIGTSVLPATDKALVVTPANGAPLTIANAFVKTMPNATFSGNNPLLGTMEFEGLLADDSSPATAANYFSNASAATGVALPGLDKALDVNYRYSLTRNAIEYLAREGGFRVEWQETLEPDYIDGLGTVNYTLTSLQANLIFVPANLTEAAAATLHDFATAIGGEDTPQEAVISAANAAEIQFTLADTVIASERSQVYSPNNPRHGEITFQTVRSHTSGTIDAIATWGEVPA